MMSETVLPERGGPFTADAINRLVKRIGERANFAFPVHAHMLRQTNCRALVVASPSGFARLVTKAGTPDEGGGVPPSAAPDMDLFLRVCAELGDEILGPPGALPD